MISVEEALARVLALARALPTQTVPLAGAAGRMLAGPVAARRDQPPFDASAMDGYAICGAPAPGDSLVVIGMAAAGHAFAGRVGAGQAVRIFTGAPLPEGADRVVIQEDVLAEGDRILLNDRLDEGLHVRPRGQDFRAGETLSARRLRPNDLALLAAMNIAEVAVARRPVVALIPTGDELVMPGEAPRADQIIASNGFALKALAEAEGAEVRMLPIAPDTEAGLAAVLTLAEGADLVVTIGGASVGDHDLVARVAGAMGMERTFYKIAMRPGKPLMAGQMGTAVMLGLPGNPVSSIVCAHLFLLPLIRAMQGVPDPAPKPARAILAEDLAENGARAHYMRARLYRGSGLPHIRPLGRQDSALLRLLTEADALLIRPVADPARKAGEELDYLAI